MNVIERHGDLRANFSLNLSARPPVRRDSIQTGQSGKSSLIPLPVRSSTFSDQLTNLPKVDPKQITNYQAKYFAYELQSADPSGSSAKLAGGVGSGQLDSKSASGRYSLFRLQLPLSKGVLLADEVLTCELDGDLPV